MRAKLCAWALPCLLVPLYAGCWFINDPCADAKQHLCEKLPGMGCSTLFMDNAVAGVKSECGSAEASRYITYAEGACRSNTLVCGNEGPSGTCPAPRCGSPVPLTYSGTAEADGRSATLELTFSGNCVDGKLTAGPVCGNSIRLTKTDITFSLANLSGVPWESEGATITGSWTGGDYDCDGKLMADYPQSGSVTITVTSGTVYLQRVASGGKYVFPGRGRVYTPPDCGDAGVDRPLWLDRAVTDGRCIGPSVSNVSPVAAWSGDTVTVTGSGFGSSGSGGEVWFGQVKATEIVSYSDTAIQVKVPFDALGGQQSVSVKLAGKSCGSFAGFTVEQGCVSAGTMVVLAGGTQKPIEEIAIGDYVQAVDPRTLQIKDARVQGVLAHRARKFKLQRVMLAGERDLRVTGNHPVLTSDGQFVSVDRLRPGDVVYTFDLRTHRAVASLVLSIVRDESIADVVYNLKTTASNYFAADILVHNKCLQAGSLVDTPAGPRPVQSIRVGDRVYGAEGGRRVATRVTHVYAKSTVLGSLPGKRVSPAVAVTANHQLQFGSGFVAAARTGYPDVAITGSVYDLKTATGNYYADGVLMKGE